MGDNIWNHNQVTTSKAIFASLWAVSWYIITITFPVPDQSSCITQKFFYNCERKDTYVASQGTAKQGCGILKVFRKLICNDIGIGMDIGYIRYRHGAEQTPISTLSNIVHLVCSHIIVIQTWWSLYFNPCDLIMINISYIQIFQIAIQEPPMYM